MECTGPKTTLAVITFNAFYLNKQDQPFKQQIFAGGSLPAFLINVSAREISRAWGTW